MLSHQIDGTGYSIDVQFHTLMKAEKNYFKLEKEALAIIVFSVAHFRDYLYGNRFELVIDYKPLTGLFS